MTDKTRIFQFNKTSILIEFDSEINEKLLDFILSLKENIIDKNTKQILQVTTSFNSLLIIYISTINNFYDEKMKLLQLISEVNVQHKSNSEFKKIPVCYEADFGCDLDLLSEDLGLSISEIIKKHTQAIYTVYFIGFLPGFPYLGGLDSSLFHKRKSDPRRQIPEGSVGIADQQTGIYPTDSPGGWQIIGRSPIQLFDSNRTDKMCYLKAGDRIQFESISKEEFEYIQSEKSNNW